jgi:hypothetical protein
MKPSLPICIPAIPSHENSPKIWRRIASILQAIAEHEQRRKLKDDRAIVTNALFVAQYLAHKSQWANLWKSLLDREVLHIGEAPKVKPPKARPEPELEAIAEPPPKPKTQRPTKPPKNVEEKPKTAGKKKRRKRVRNRERLTDRKSPTYLYVFTSLAPCLSGLLSVITLYSFFAYSAPLCPRVKIPIADRPDGQRIKALLAYKARGGEYASLKVYLPSLKRRYRMNSDVLRLLLDWSNPKRTRTRKKVESDKKKGVAKRIISTEQINSVLTDKWQDAVTISFKLNELLGENIELRRLSKLLYNRSVAGEIYRYNRDHHEISYFSKVQATEFENEWTTLEMAYQLAVSRGCPFARNTFRKTHRFDYSAWGIEFRKSAPANECSLLRYRDIQS